MLRELRKKAFPLKPITPKKNETCTDFSKIPAMNSKITTNYEEKTHEKT
jgi:hypothetical protein